MYFSFFNHCSRARLSLQRSLYNWWKLLSVSWSPLPLIAQPYRARNLKFDRILSIHLRFSAFSCMLDNTSPMPCCGRQSNHLFKSFLVATAGVMLSEADCGIFPIGEAPGNERTFTVSSRQSHLLLLQC